jgi:rod shape-determining protein MreD
VKYLFWAILIFLSFVLQARLSILGVSPDLSILLVYAAGIKYGEKKGMLTGVLIGALEDSMSFSIFGPNLLSKGVIGFLSALFVTGSLLRWTPPLGTIAVLFLTFLDNSIVFLSLSLFDKAPSAISTALFISLMQSILNAPAGLLIRPKNAD